MYDKVDRITVSLCRRITSTLASSSSSSSSAAAAAAAEVETPDNSQCAVAVADASIPHSLRADINHTPAGAIFHREHLVNGSSRLLTTPQFDDVAGGFHVFLLAVGGTYVVAVLGSIGRRWNHSRSSLLERLQPYVSAGVLTCFDHDAARIRHVHVRDFYRATLC